jgi:hypothetical protein
MSKPIECSEHIPFYTPDRVFEIGTLLETLPTDHGFTIEANSDRFAEGVLIRVGIELHDVNFHIDGKVAEFIPAERVLLKGSSWVGKAAVWLNLSPVDDGTLIDYGVQIHHNIVTKAAERKVQKHLDNNLSGFAAEYRQNVVDILDAERRPVRRKKAV